MSETFGRHYLVDLIGCDPELLRRVDPARAIFLRAVEISKATVVGERFHQFEPEGMSGVVLIAESHISVHTWPEDAFAAVDIFTCGEEMDPQAAIDHLSAALSADETVVRVLTRGRLREDDRGEAEDG